MDNFKLEKSLRDFGGEEKLTISARDLHSRMGVGRVFATWIKNRIAQEQFVEGVDYIVHREISMANPNHPRILIDYYFTIEKAKYMAQIEQNAAGDKVRLYFQACDYLATKGGGEPNTYAECLRILADAEDDKLNSME